MCHASDFRKAFENNHRERLARVAGEEADEEE